MSLNATQWTTLGVAAVGPVATVLTALLGRGFRRLSLHEKVRADIDLLAQLPAESEWRQELLTAIDANVEELLTDRARRVRSRPVRAIAQVLLAVSLYLGGVSVYATIRHPHQVLLAVATLASAYALVGIVAVLGLRYSPRRTLERSPTHADPTPVGD